MKKMLLWQTWIGGVVINMLRYIAYILKMRDQRIMKNKKIKVKPLNPKKEYIYAICITFELDKNRKWWQFSRPKYIEKRTRIRLEKCGT